MFVRSGNPAVQFRRVEHLHIVTVTGPIPSEELKTTSPHEHILVDGSCWWQKPLEASKMALAEAPVTMNVLGELRRNGGISLDNWKQLDIDLAISELSAFKGSGGRSVVDVTVPGIGRDPRALRAISEATAVNIICATGWYLAPSHPPYVKHREIDELADIMMGELTDEIGYSGIKAGIIKVGLSEPLLEEEIKVLRAAGRAQAKTRKPLTIHPGLYNLEMREHAKKADVYLDILKKENADLSKVYVGHMCDTCEDIAYHKSVIDKYDVAIAYDSFGNENYLDNLWPGCGGMTDRQRVRSLVELLQSGYEKYLLMAHDVCKKTLLRKYGGYGYAHILDHIVPWLRVLGVSEGQIRAMLVDNPRRLLATNE